MLVDTSCTMNNTKALSKVTPPRLLPPSKKHKCDHVGRIRRNYKHVWTPNERDYSSGYTPRPDIGEPNNDMEMTNDDTNSSNANPLSCVEGENIREQ